MCGIAGIVATNHLDQIGEMIAAIKHRGPDGEGFYKDHLAALGQCRLSIIDIEGGKQPIANETGELQLICNGEIYNSPELRERLIGLGHRFSTRTDVEVIVHAYEEYGEDCVKHLRGMFAFAIWDLPNQTLFMGRDHMGQKPLFYVHRGNEIAFASEIKALLSSGLICAEMNEQALWHYSSLRFMPDDVTLFKGIHKLPAATCLRFHQGRVQLSKYWTLSFQDKLSGSIDSIEEQLHGVLQDTVNVHLLSDVRVGSFLSGGIDSTTVASLMAKASNSPVAVFSIGVEEQGFNELPAAREVASAWSMEAHERIAKANLVSLLPRMVYHMDEPADPYGVGMYLASQLASEHVKVVLSGDGADESFAGYDRYAGQRVVDYYRWLPRWLRAGLVEPITGLIPESFAYKSLAQKIAWVQEMARYDNGTRYGQSMSFLRFTDAAKNELFTSRVKAALDEPDSMRKILVHFDADNASVRADRMLYTDLMTRVPDHNLVIGDRMSMAHSLEVRNPFVDHRLVEFAARIPADMKMRGGALKYILRRTASRYIPKSVLNRPKQGFGFPLGHWLRNDLRTFLTNLMSRSAMVEQGVFQQHAIQNVIQEHLSGKVDHNFRLWILINMELWHRIYIQRQSIDDLQHEMERLAGGG